MISSSLYGPFRQNHRDGFFFYCAGTSAGKNEYKNNSLREQRFRLHGCTEDDTISLLKVAYIFGCARRFLLAQEPVFLLFSYF